MEKIAEPALQEEVERPSSSSRFQCQPVSPPPPRQDDEEMEDDDEDGFSCPCCLPR